MFLRRKVRKTLYDLYLSVFLAIFLGEVYEKGKGTLAEVGMHLIECISEQKCINNT